MDFLYIEDIQICPFALLMRVRLRPTGCAASPCSTALHNEPFGFITAFAAPKHKVRGTGFTPPLHFGFISSPSYLVFREQINFCGQRVSSAEQIGNRMRINTQIKKGR